MRASKTRHGGGTKITKLTKTTKTKDIFFVLFVNFVTFVAAAVGRFASAGGNV